MVNPNKPEQPASPEEKTPALSNVGPPATPTPDLLVLALAPTWYTKENLLGITKLCMDWFFQAQVSCPKPGPRESPLKAQFSDFYYGKSRMECYYFYQQCEDHFATASATGPNRTPFATSFFGGRISFCLNQHKLRHQATKDPLSWDEFKAFLRKSLRDSRLFVNIIWNKIKPDCQYQQEEVQDWASHLEYLQSIFIEFDASKALEEFTFIWIFWDGLKSSIAAQIEQCR